VTPSVRPLYVIAFVAAAAGVLTAQGHPSHVITNGQLTARVYLPDAKAGFYRSTRFDWSGAIGSLEYKGHQDRDGGRAVRRSRGRTGSGIHVEVDVRLFRGQVRER
jgi:hypothetical protein